MCVCVCVCVCVDPCVRFLSAKLIKQEERMSSGFHPALRVRDVLTEDPGASCKKLKRKVAAKTSAEHDRKIRDELRCLPVQGSLVAEDESIGDKAWATAIRSLPEKVMKFGLNAVSDTLPHRVNLKRWRKIESDLCPLCNNRQTLLHVLNNCQKALEMRRYTIRHDAVLRGIAETIQKHLPDTFKITVDNGDETYSFPEHICPSGDQRPDIVLWSDTKRQVWLIELTVCYESNTTQAEERKRERYANLADNIKKAGYVCYVCPVQVGSRGYIDYDSFTLIRDLLKIKSRSYLLFLTKITSIAITQSLTIWKSRNLKND